MKKLAIAILLIFLSFTVSSEPYKEVIYRLESTQDDGYFNLRLGNHTNDQLNLDCRSFLHGISLTKNNSTTNSKFLILNHEECVDAFYDIKDQVPVCLTVDFDLRYWMLETEYESCSSTSALDQPMVFSEPL